MTDRVRTDKNTSSETRVPAITIGRSSMTKLVNLPNITNVMKTMRTSNSHRCPESTPSRQKKLIPRNMAPKSPLRELIPTARAVSAKNNVVAKTSGIIKKPSPIIRNMNPMTPDRIRSNDSIRSFPRMFFTFESLPLPSSSGWPPRRRRSGFARRQCACRRPRGWQTCHERRWRFQNWPRPPSAPVPDAGA